MDELELLKKDWEKDDKKFPKLSYNEIYKMILKKSSSIVKWLFIISLLEFAFWIGISFLLKGTSLSDKIEHIETDSVIIPLTIVSYIILIYFFYRFYRNYRNISVTDSSKILMENILKTRKTVKHYVIFNLATVVIGTFLGAAYVLKNDVNWVSRVNQASANGEVLKFYAGLFIAAVILLTVVIIILLLFYGLIYGLLLKRLNKNYKELKKLEV